MGPAPGRRLLPGETLLWSGQPAHGMLLQRSDIFLVPFSLMWCGFAVFWEFSVVSMDAPLLFRLWGIPFVLIGIYLVAGRFVHDAYLRYHTTYAVTDRRVLICRAGALPSVTALSLGRLPDLQMTERGDGRGTIVFSHPGMRAYGRPGADTPRAMGTAPAFVAIANPHEVFALIQRAATPG